ncbi:MAG: hypothetical protein E7299_08090 [Lachnospiraceae bacterium]|nr:hypothetical protein [Lachnospiraceae bacterium]
MSDDEIRTLYKKTYGNLQKMKEATGYNELELRRRLYDLNIKSFKQSRRGDIVDMLQKGYSKEEIMETLDVSMPYVNNVMRDLRLEKSLQEQEQKIRVQIVKRKKPVAYPIMIRGRRYLDVTEEFMEKISLEYRNIVMHENMCV